MTSSKPLLSRRRTRALESAMWALATGCMGCPAFSVSFLFPLTRGAASQFCLLTEDDEKGSCFKVTILHWKYYMENTPPPRFIYLFQRKNEHV